MNVRRKKSLKRQKEGIFHGVQHAPRQPQTYLAQRAHHSAQLLGGDGAITIAVKQAECLLELRDLLLGQLVCMQSRVRRGWETAMPRQQLAAWYIPAMMNT